MSELKVVHKLPETIDIEKVDQISARTFKEEYFNPRKPVLIKNGIENWDLMCKCSVSDLNQMLASENCTVVNHSRVASSKLICSVSEYFEKYPEQSAFTYQILDHENDKEIPKILSTIPLPNTYFNLDDVIVCSMTYSYTAGGVLPHIHYDAFNFLRSGAKRWVLFDANPETHPDAHQLLQGFYEKYPAGTHSKDWFAHELGNMREQGIKVYDFEQHAGDIVYLPAYFAHTVLNLTTVAALVVMVNRSGEHAFKASGNAYKNSPAYKKDQKNQ